MSFKDSESVMESIHNRSNKSDSIKMDFQNYMDKKNKNTRPKPTYNNKSNTAKKANGKISSINTARSKITPSKTLNNKSPINSQVSARPRIESVSPLAKK